MPDLRILSAGAAQSVVERIAEAFRSETGHVVHGTFGAVGAMRDRLTAGETADVVLLTGPLIDELIRTGHVVAGTRRDLGTVGTGVAVRAGVPLPDVGDESALRGRLLAATRLVCPDPATATAGKVVLQALERLGIAGELRAKLKFFPNGYAAMKWLAENGGSADIGITQITEIRANSGVTYAGPLPGALQVKTTYAAALSAKAGAPDAARAFIERLTSAATRSVLTQAGYEVDQH